MELPVAGVFEVDASGLITLWRDYFDMETFTSEMAKLLS
jgi:limonene-1,2-epoxide hydrolase